MNTEIYFIGLNDKGVDDLENTAPGMITVIKPILENAEIVPFFHGEMELFQLFTFRVVQKKILFIDLSFEMRFKEFLNV